MVGCIASSGRDLDRYNRAACVKISIRSINCVESSSLSVISICVRATLRISAFGRCYYPHDIRFFDPLSAKDKASSSDRTTRCH
jgi:hypothetical protein